MVNFYISECENNEYGAGCLEKCGQCLGGDKCNFVNGICSNGCEAGYYNFSWKAGIIEKTFENMIQGGNCLFQLCLITFLRNSQLKLAH